MLQSKFIKTSYFEITKSDDVSDDTIIKHLVDDKGYREEQLTIVKTDESCIVKIDFN